MHSKGRGPSDVRSAAAARLLRTVRPFEGGFGGASGVTVGCQCMIFFACVRLRSGAVEVWDSACSGGRGRAGSEASGKHRGRGGVIAASVAARRGLEGRELAACPRAPFAPEPAVVDAGPGCRCCWCLTVHVGGR